MGRLPAIPGSFKEKYVNALEVLGSVYAVKAITDRAFFDMLGETLEECFSGLYLHTRRIHESKSNPSWIKSFNRANLAWLAIFGRTIIEEAYISKYLDREMFRDHTIALTDDEIILYFDEKEVYDQLVATFATEVNVNGSDW